MKQLTLDYYLLWINIMITLFYNYLQVYMCTFLYGDLISQLYFDLLICIIMG